MSLTKLSTWTILDTGSSAAKKNMAIDEQLLESLAWRPSPPILHLYEWQRPSATYGYFINPASLLSLSATRKASLDLARRPTGGGVIFHLTDWAFSLLIPASHPAYSVNILDNYAFVNSLVIEVVRRFSGRQAELRLQEPEQLAADVDARHFCMAKPTKYDVMVEGRKVGGGAQRRTRFGFLHQGTISLAIPDGAFLEQVLLPGTGVHEAMQHTTCSLLEGPVKPQHIAEARHALAQLFKTVISNPI